MRDFSLGGLDRDLTVGEELFLNSVLGEEPPFLDAWLHADADGSPWLLISMDLVEGNAVRDTLRLDFDSFGIRGEWSPSFLNWDDGVRSTDAGLTCESDDGLVVAGSDPVELAVIARRWFEEHYRRWPTSDRRSRWKDLN